MIPAGTWRAAFAAAALFVSTACQGEAARPARADSAAVKAKIALTIQTAGGPRQFLVERAETPAEQERGLMYRTDIPENGGMLFFPYPADGSGPHEASFWMKNTPSALDLIFIRRDGTIVRVAANAEPYSETPIKSGEPVAAVLEINGGRAAALGIAQGDRVTWEGQGR